MTDPESTPCEGRDCGAEVAEVVQDLTVSISDVAAAVILVEVEEALRQAEVVVKEVGELSSRQVVFAVLAAASARVVGVDTLESIVIRDVVASLGLKIVRLKVHQWCG